MTSPNGPDLTFFATSMGEMKQALTHLTNEQRQQLVMLTELRTQYDGLATREELANQISNLKLALQPVSAQASAAHERLDQFETDHTALDARVKVLEDSGQLTAGRRQAMQPFSALAWTVLGAVLSSVAITAVSLFILNT